MKLIGNDTWLQFAKNRNRTPDHSNEPLQFVIDRYHVRDWEKIAAVIAMTAGSAASAARMGRRAAWQASHAQRCAAASHPVPDPALRR